MSKREENHDRKQAGSLKLTESHLIPKFTHSDQELFALAEEIPRLAIRDPELVAEIYENTTGI
jgi:hypothetical protein